MEGQERRRNSYTNSTKDFQEKQRKLSRHVSYVNFGESTEDERAVGRRIFVNRSLYLDNIKFFGFDMDYTLADYKSPAYEVLGFNLTKKRLIELGYPSEINGFEYDENFPVRGLWFDSLHGNLLKVDGFGNILFCCHGLRFLKGGEISEKYPNKFIQLDEKRIYVMNSLFNLPETHMLACLIEFFKNNDGYKEVKDGFMYGDLLMSFKSIFQDVRSSVDFVHSAGDLKAETCRNLDKFVYKDARLPQLLHNLRASGAKTFLLTNSEWWYTNKVMEFLLDFPDCPGRHWQSFFDFTFVDARKPLFFAEGTVLRIVDKETGQLMIGRPTGNSEGGEVYSGGTSGVLSKMMGAKGGDVLYVGDHIFGDVLKSKKLRGWRTFLIIPELNDELRVWTSKQVLFDRLQLYDKELSNLYRDMDSSATNRPDIKHIKDKIQEVSRLMEQAYCRSGSLFRSGSRQTFFASQVVRYSDIYSGNLLNLLYYPPSYMFRAAPMLLPHESTVAHTQMLGREADRRISVRNSESSSAGNWEDIREGKKPDQAHDLDDDDVVDEGSQSDNSEGEFLEICGKR